MTDRDRERERERASRLRVQGTHAPFTFTFTNPVPATAGSRLVAATRPAPAVPREVMRTERAADDRFIQCGGRLSPWANPVSGALGWQVLTASRCLALAMAGGSGTVRSTATEMVRPGSKQNRRLPSP